MNKRVIQFQSGFPDQFNKYCSGRYLLEQHDQVRIADYTPQELLDAINDPNHDTYIHVQDDRDLAYIATLPLEVQKKCMTCMTKDGVVNTKDFVDKFSTYYQNVSKNTLLTYPDTKSYSVEEFKKLMDEVIKQPPTSSWKTKGYVIKTSMGAGSRGVYVINPNKEPDRDTREQYKELTEWIINDAIYWATTRNCKILIQDLAYTDTINTKFELSIIIRNSRLISYRWDSYLDNVSTNWIHGSVVYTDYTYKVAKSVADYMISLGITDATCGMDGYTDYNGHNNFLEVNWRCQNCHFIFECLGIDYMDMWLYPEDYNIDQLPSGIFKYCRYWRAKLDEIPKGHTPLGSINKMEE